MDGKLIKDDLRQNNNTIKINEKLDVNKGCKKIPITSF